MRKTPVLSRRTALAACALLAGAPLAHGDDASDARAVIGEVHYAAEKRDLDLLARSMADRFTYSFGDGPSKTHALAEFKSDPKLFDALARVISMGCRPENEGPVRDYVCPQHFADKKVLSFGYRAGFSKGKDGVWRMDYFVTGD